MTFKHPSQPEPFCDSLCKSNLKTKYFAMTNTQLQRYEFGMHMNSSISPPFKEFVSFKHFHGTHPVLTYLKMPYQGYPQHNAESS